MPFRPDDHLNGPLALSLGFDLNPDPFVPESSVFGAAWRLENPIGSHLAREDFDVDAPFDPSFRPFDEIQGTVYEPYWERFVEIRNGTEAAKMRAQIDREIEDQRMIDAAGPWGMLSVFGAAVLSPTSLLPGGSVVKGARGVQIGRTSLRVAGATGLAVAIDEIALHDTQETRTGSESAFAIGGSVLLGGLLGAATAKLSKQEFKGVSVQVEQALESTFNLDDSIRSVNAASASADLSLRGEGIFQAVRNVPVVGRTILGTDPLLRTVLHDLPAVREASARLAEPVLEMQVNANGKTALGGNVPVETRVKARRQTELAGLYADLTRYYGEYAKDGPVGQIGTITAPLTGKWQHLLGYDRKLSVSEFSQEVAKALRREGKHPIPQVQSVADNIRQKFFEPIRQEAEDLGILGQQVELSDPGSYLTRVYNTEKIVAHLGDGSADDIAPVLERAFRESQMEQWRKTIVDAVDEAGRTQRLEAGAIQDTINSRRRAARALLECMKTKSLGVCARQQDLGPDDLSEIQNYVASAGDETLGVEAYLKQLDDEANELIADLPLPDDLETKAAVQDAINSIRGLKPGQHHLQALLAKPTRARVLDVPDEVLEPWLETDIRVVLGRYFDSMVPDLEIIRQFGDLEMTEAMQKITDAENKRLTRAESPKERNRIGKDAKRAREDLMAMRDRIRGVYRLPDNPRNGWVVAGRMSRTLSYTALLGGFMLSALPDIGRLLGQVGSEVFGGLATVTDPKRLGLSMKQASELGAAAEWYLNSRAMEIANLTDPYRAQSRIERAVGETGRVFSYVNGVIPWNASWKTIGGALIASRMSKAAVAVQNGKATTKQRRILAANGVEPWMASRIARQIEEHGDLNGALWLPQAGSWGDAEAFDAFRNAMTREFDLMVPTPGQDKPLTFSSETGKFFFQFKNFAFSAYHRVLLASLQKADADMLATIVPMMALGVMVSNIKSDQYGQERKTGAALWEDALDRSGLAGWLFEVHGPANALAGGALSLSGEELSRFRTKATFEGLLGPSYGVGVGLAEGIASAARDASGNGRLTDGDIDKIKRAVPGNNLWYLMKLFEELDAKS